MGKYTGVIERLSDAQEADRGLDAQVALAVGFEPEGLGCSFEQYCAIYDSDWSAIGNDVDRLNNVLRGTLPHYTASIDAALALVDRMLPGFDWILGRTNDGLTIHCQLGGPIMHFGATPALAVLVSLFRHLDAEATP